MAPRQTPPSALSLAWAPGERRLTCTSGSPTVSQAVVTPRTRSAQTSTLSRRVRWDAGPSDCSEDRERLRTRTEVAVGYNHAYSARGRHALRRNRLPGSVEREGWPAHPTRPPRCAKRKVEALSRVRRAASAAGVSRCRLLNRPPSTSRRACPPALAHP